MTGPSFAAPATTPAAPAAPAAPRPPARSRPGDKPDENGMRVLTYLRLHWLMILFCGSLLGTTGAFAAWELLASKYESYAMLQVSSVPTALANQNNPNQGKPGQQQGGQQGQPGQQTQKPGQGGQQGGQGGQGGQNQK